MDCPHCGSTANRNGTNKNGTSRYKCKACLKTWSESTGRPRHRPRKRDELITPAEAAREHRKRKRDMPWRYPLSTENDIVDW